MKYTFKLFNFMGGEVNVKVWILLLLLFFSVTEFISIFLAVLIHEMAHIYVARKLNYKTGSIMIDVFYGYAETGNISDNKDSIKVSLAGPLSNLILASVSFFLNIFLNIEFLTAFMFINLLLFIFNILPIYPMDGGKVTRSFLAIYYGGYKARYYSSILTIIMSILLIAFSIYFKLYFIAIFSVLFLYMGYIEYKTMTKR